jgi:hypothetical protein
MMKQKAAKRARIARVRRVQHSLAAAAAARAENHATMLETSADRLAQLRFSLAVDKGTSSGAAIANLGELAMRLDDARHGLNDAIASARANADQQAEARLAARRRQESANKLENRAAAALAEFLERNAITSPRRKSRQILGETR